MTTIEQHNQWLIIKAQAAIIRATARISGMNAENELRKLQGQSPAYNEEAFEKAILDEGVSYNDIQGLFLESM